LSEPGTFSTEVNMHTATDLTRSMQWRRFVLNDLTVGPSTTNRGFASANQPCLTNKYRNINEKVLKYNENIYFNKQCLSKISDTVFGCACRYRLEILTHIRTTGWEAQKLL
jgi:hypothetical protein